MIHRTFKIILFSISRILLLILTFLAVKGQSSGAGVLIDTQWVLTSDSFVPSSVLIGPNEYPVQAVVVQQEYELSLLYLEHPVLSAEPTPRIRYSGKLSDLPLTKIAADGEGVFYRESKAFLAGIQTKSGRTLLSKKINT